MKRMPLFLALVLTLLPAAGAQGREKPKSTIESDLKEAKDGANRALDSVEKGLKKAAGPAKDSANRALQAVDDGVHDLIDDGKKKKKK
jgi:hypothetical protein